MLSDRTIGVVVPAYNEEKQIGKVIETMPGFVDRIIIVDDGSTDATLEVVKSYLNDSKTNRSSITLEPSKIIANGYNDAELKLQELNRSEIKWFPNSEIINSDFLNNRIVLIKHKKRSGNGKAVARGLKFAKDYGLDAVAILDGDGQMDPNELFSIISPILDCNVDYVKGNRLIHRSSWLVIPRIRFIGNSILSILNKMASGFWKISDTQTGYVALSKKAINSIKLYKLYKSYVG
jgi:Glycosyltransferases involved in cell wall biogenesis